MRQLTSFAEAVDGHRADAEEFRYLADGEQDGARTLGGKML
jgi:hypothetical protein